MCGFVAASHAVVAGFDSRFLLRQHLQTFAARTSSAKVWIGACPAFIVNLLLAQCAFHFAPAFVALRDARHAL